MNDVLVAGNASILLLYELDVKKLKSIVETLIAVAAVAHNNTTTYTGAYVFRSPWNSPYEPPMLEVANVSYGKLAQYY